MQESKPHIFSAKKAWNLKCWAEFTSPNWTRELPNSLPKNENKNQKKWEQFTNSKSENTFHQTELPENFGKDENKTKKE